MAYRSKRSSYSSRRSTRSRSSYGRVRSTARRSGRSSYSRGYSRGGSRGSRDIRLVVEQVAPQPAVTAESYAAGAVGVAGKARKSVF